MATFLVLYLAPAQVIEDWKKTAPENRQAAEDKMRADWTKWMVDHAAMVTDTKAAGKTKRAQSSGVSDVKNDIMLYSVVEADSHDAAATLFATHPHLQIPQSSIEIMEVRSMTGG